jgi:hypothetical protein
MAQLKLNAAATQMHLPMKARGGAPPRFPLSRGPHLHRKSRYDLRASKRWGDSRLFLIPTPWLWLESGCIPTLVGPPICGGTPPIDLWR